MNKSENIQDLAAALSRAQAAIKGASKDSENPYFKSSYADLSSIWEAIREPLTSNGLSVTQTSDKTEYGMVIETMLMHSSGQWISGVYPINPVKNDPQSLGSAITYARRYALAAIVGVYQVDDDAEAAQGRTDLDKKNPEKKNPESTLKLTNSSPDNFVISFGKYRGKKIPEIPTSEIKSYLTYLENGINESKRKGTPISIEVIEAIENMKKYLNEQNEKPIQQTLDVSDDFDF
jgi:hypothetical protein